MRWLVPSGLVLAGFAVVLAAPTVDAFGGRTPLDPGPYCGDGIKSASEQCDDANSTPGDGCHNCIREFCGDGVRQPMEECDDGNTTNGDGCESTCYITSTSKCPGPQCVYSIMHSTTCQGTYQNAGTNLSQLATLKNLGTTSRAVRCWVSSDSRLRHSDARNIYADGRGVGSTYSRACVQSYNSGTLSCGVSKYWSGDDGSEKIDFLAWVNDAGGFAFVVTYLGAQSELRGITYSN